MPSKYQEYRQMAGTAERQLTSSYKSWTQFLRTAARLYKYPYNEQVMIHAQRPDATACAEYDFWNKKMGRFVRRGSTGIALIDTSGQKPQLRYVFDVADTGEREHSRPVHLWQFRAEHEDAIAATLERSYDVSGSNGIIEQMESAAAQLAKEYWADHKRDILHNIDDSYLDDYDEFNTEVQFRNAAKVSITYMLMSRCGLEPEAYLEPEDFMPVFDFNTPATVAALGTAVSEISQQVLRQIEVAIRNYERERSQKNDRIDLHEERRLPDSRSEAERGTGEHALGQVRDAAENLPSGASPHPLEPDDPVRDAVPAPAGDRRDGAAEAGADDAGADEVGWRDGSAESQRPIDVGGADEQPESTGGRGHSERAGVQLTNDVPEAEPAQPTAAYQMSLFPTEEEQIAYIDTAESANDAPSAISAFISQDDIDRILRTGGNADEARMKIIAEFSKRLKAGLISADKLNQLRHVRFLPTIEAVKEHMKKHAEFLRPRFEAVERKLTEGLGDTGCATWTHPRGGYFVASMVPRARLKRSPRFAQTWALSSRRPVPPGPMARIRATPTSASRRAIPRSRT